CERIKNPFPDAASRPAVETIVRRCIWPIALRQIAPRHPGAQHVKDRVHDRAIVSAGALAALRHQRLEKSPFVVAQIKSHDPPPRTGDYFRSNYSIRYLGTDPSDLFFQMFQTTANICEHDVVPRGGIEPPTLRFSSTS